MEMYFSKRPLDSESLSIIHFVKHLGKLEKKQQPQNVIYEFISPAERRKQKNKQF